MTIFMDNQFKTATDTPLYRQLCDHMQAAILSGELKGGLKLPSTRALADELSISRNTVLTAYRQLMAEGYIEGAEGSGTFVARVLPEFLLTTPDHKVSSKTGKIRLHQPRFSEHARLQMAASLPPSNSRMPRPFASGTPALDVFPYPIWSRLVARQARRMPESSFAYQEAAGYRPLREAIAAHVTVSRRVHCIPEQIVIVSGSQGALDLVARMLIDPGDPVWMEDPGYLGARGAFLGANAHIIPVPIDNDGLIVEAGIALEPHARLVYLTPSHQFPLGITMSLARRLEILDWAQRTGAYILEDDYDSEYRFGGRPLAALQGLDNSDRVIYIGTFSKVLFPALRIGYLILPLPLVDAFLKVRSLIDVHTPILEQTVLCDFIVEGHFIRHLRRMRTLYAVRRAALIEAARRLPLEIYSPEAGIHCVGWLPKGMDDRSLVRRGTELGLDLWSISNFCMKPLGRKGLLLGYGGYSIPKIRDGLRRLAMAMDSV
jgi:GntR family transcriptional regulator / MocR family aminotransferase